MKILVTGARGQLGRALTRQAAVRGHELVGLDLPELDVINQAAVRAAVAASRPRIIINCAAFTAVDAAETQEALAFAVNGGAVAHLQAAADEFGARLIQISTDYVFSGDGTRALGEDEPPAPKSVYGRSKLAGERAAQRAVDHLVVRTAWMFGEGGSNFVEAIRRQLEGGNRHLRVVADQRGCPTYAGDLADALIALSCAQVRGILHVVNGGQASWHEFATEIAAQLGIEATIEPVTSGEIARAAPRPAFAVLDTRRLAAILGSALPDWQDALARYLRSGGGASVS